MQIPVKETIQKRISTRTYKPKKLTDVDKAKLFEAISQVSNPFQDKVRIQFIEKDTSNNGEKLGTYGVIKGAKSFLGLTTSADDKGLIAAGYQFENLILQATHMGLSTVWLAATFSREQFEKAMEIKKDEVFPAISPIGYAADKRSMTENVMRMTMKSDKRKAWEELFFDTTFAHPLTKMEAKEYESPLEMLRLAPSATNAQPWRVVKIKSDYHFFITFDKNAKPEDIMIKKVDLGIALSHFHLVALENGLEGSFEDQKNVDVQVPENTLYMMTWKSMN